MSIVPAMIDQSFAFAHGRIGVLQQFLLARTDTDRLLGAHDLKEAERILTELKLTANVDQGIGHGDALLTAIAAWVKREATDMAPGDQRNVFDILWLEHDAPLLAYLLKQKHGLTSDISSEPSDFLAAFTAADLKDVLVTHRSVRLPDHLVTFVNDALRWKSPTPSDIDARVAAWLAAAQTRLAKESKSAGIRRFVRHRIDLQNIRTALRLIDAKPEERRPYLLAGGSINLRDLLGDRKSIAHAVELADLSLALAKTIRAEESDINALERRLSDVLAEDIAEMWNVTLSVEPLFAFAALAASHLRVLRVILIGKRAMLSPQDIKKMLPPFIPVSHYVG